MQQLFNNKTYSLDFFADFTLNELKEYIRKHTRILRNVIITAGKSFIFFGISKDNQEVLMKLNDRGIT